MKKLICTLTLGAGLLLGLSGCDLYQPDVDSLLTPPRPFRAANRGG